MKEDGNVRRCAVKYDTLVTFSSLSQNIWQKQLKGPKTYFGPQFQFIMAGKAELAVLGACGRDSSLHGRPGSKWQEIGTGRYCR